MQPELQGIEIFLEIGHPLHPHTGRLSDQVRDMLGDDFAGLTIDDKLLHLYVAKNAAGDKVVEAVMMVLDYEPPTFSPALLSSPQFDVAIQLADLQRQLDELRAVFRSPGGLVDALLDEMKRRSIGT